MTEVVTNGGRMITLEVDNVGEMVMLQRWSV